MTIGYTYGDVLAASKQVDWRIEDVVGRGQRLDFRKPFLPESLARVAPLAFLTPRERLVLNQIRAESYLHVLAVTEEFILAFVLEHAWPIPGPADEKRLALFRFAAEEAKHILLFRRFGAVFRQGFGTPCAHTSMSRDIPRRVMDHGPLAVALAILHIEWMTQRHYVDSVRNDENLDPLFKSLLKHHWMEEAQHTKLDALTLQALAGGSDPADIAAAAREYLQIVDLLDEWLRAQVVLSLESLRRATGRTLSPGEREIFLTVQHQASRWTFLGTGMTHPRFLQAVGELSKEGRAAVERAAPRFC